ncbi:pseudouridine synthase [Salisaeta longa]|uniref:pseudouridine synthase n=1 Tax=Salisaeta longa TaxID=503170 RepID=UPI0003B5C48A|nr:pseudouridine synthase [Salisaeta longa]
MGSPHQASQQAGTRINKYIAHTGYCSRRDADTLVAEGRVTLDGEVVTQHGTRVQSGQTVRVDGEVVEPVPFDYLLLHKPKNTISTTDDPKDRDTVLDVIGVPDDNPDGLFPVGRLDRNTTGALLVTNDGDLAHKLMHPRYEVSKIYFARTRKPFKPHLIDRLQRGVSLDDGRAAADRVAYIRNDDPHGIALEIHEGRNRQIRRMFEALGHELSQLERVKYAGLTCDGLARGEWRRLHPGEVDALYRRVNHS